MFSVVFCYSIFLWTGMMVIGVTLDVSFLIYSNFNPVERQTSFWKTSDTTRVLGLLGFLDLF